MQSPIGLERSKGMKKYGRVWIAIWMAVAMVTTTMGAMIAVDKIILEAASIRLNKTSLNMKVGQSKWLKVKGTKKTVKWSVSNKKIVKVTKKGKVTAKKAGNAKVYAKIKGKKLICKVKVVNATIVPTITTESSIHVFPTETSEPKETVEQTNEPEVTSIPVTGIEEIKVGDTKTTTGSGVSITYTARQNLLIIKMENTTKDAKSVSVTMDFLDSKGNIVNDISCLYPETISHLSAGQTYYAFAQCANTCDVESYVIQKLQIGEASFHEVDCLSNIKVTSEEQKNKEGQVTGITELTYEYIGEDISKLNGKSVHVYGAVVYYDSNNNIVDFFNLRETIKISSENNKITGYSFSLEENADHYIIILSGAEYSGDDYEYDG